MQGKIIMQANLQSVAASIDRKAHRHMFVNAIGFHPEGDRPIIDLCSDNLRTQGDSGGEFQKALAGATPQEFELDEVRGLPIDKIESCAAHAQVVEFKGIQVGPYMRGKCK